MTHAANEQLGFHHPTNPDWDHLSFCQLAAPPERRDGVLGASNAVVIRPARSTARPAAPAARRGWRCSRRKVSCGSANASSGRSIIGSEFYCHIESLTELGGRPAILPCLSGRAWITGIHQYLLDPDDPWPQGYRLSDTWPDGHC
ncbi:proline racemase family protein [Pseudomonas aeruginosa]|nr:proline racemase family protein [Pseudomonas aeruginosa]